MGPFKCNIDAAVLEELNSYEIGAYLWKDKGELVKAYTQHGSKGGLNKEKSKHIGGGWCYNGSNP